jgi:glutathione synthase/RimK-type ligase-like ATP-grasp enzyme
VDYHPRNNAAASHKVEQLTRACSAGLATPETLMTRNPDALRRFWQQCNGEVIVKPMISGYLERDDPGTDTQIYTSQVLAKHIEGAQSTLPSCPTLFQRAIRKQLDVRIAVIDGRFFPIGIKASDGEGQRLDIRRNSMNDVCYSPVALPTDVRAKLLQLMKEYDLRFAAIDMAIDTEGQWVFFEINPNGQWAWTDLAGATDIASGFLEVFVEK